MSGDFKVSLYELSKLNKTKRNVLLRRSENDLEVFLEKVKPIIEDVRIKGDLSLIHI